jgi:hypothetical protein
MDHATEGVEVGPDAGLPEAKIGGHRSLPS